jgi:hypothetical protein
MAVVKRRIFTILSARSLLICMFLCAGWARLLWSDYEICSMFSRHPAGSARVQEVGRPAAWKFPTKILVFVIAPICWFSLWRCSWRPSDCENFGAAATAAMTSAQHPADARNAARWRRDWQSSQITGDEVVYFEKPFPFPPRGHARKDCWSSITAARE